MSGDMENYEVESVRQLGDDPDGELKRDIICSLLWERREN